jgi:hypothetical protein
MKAYRINNAVRAVVSAESGVRLTELPAGSVFFPTALEPNANGMIEGTSNNRSVLIFLHDLTEKCELMNIRIPSATVRIGPAPSQP